MLVVGPPLAQTNPDESRPRGRERSRHHSPLLRGKSSTARSRPEEHSGMNRAVAYAAGPQNARLAGRFPIAWTSHRTDRDRAGPLLDEATVWTVGFSAARRR